MRPNDPGNGDPLTGRSPGERGEEASDPARPGPPGPVTRSGDAPGSGDGNAVYDFLRRFYGVRVEFGATDDDRASLWIDGDRFEAFRVAFVDGAVLAVVADGRVESVPLDGTTDVSTGRVGTDGGRRALRVTVRAGPDAGELLRLRVAAPVLSRPIDHVEARLDRAVTRAPGRSRWGKPRTRFDDATADRGE